MEENKLGTMPIGKLLIRMSIPMMVSFFIQALYNVVDAMFVSRISENALAAVSIAFPIQQLIIAIAIGTGVGVMTVVSRLNGAQEYARANKVMNVSFFLIFVFSIVFIVLGLTVIRPYFEVQTDNRKIVEMGIQYASICAIFAIGNFTGAVLEKLLVGCGFSVPAMISQASGALTNIIFDPLLIFGIGPFPKMGIAGAAAATVFGQIVGAVVAVVFTIKKIPLLKFNLSSMLPDRFSLENIFAVAFPSMITVGIGAVLTFGMNQILLSFSITATAAFAIWMKVQNFAFMPVFGMNNGMLPIASFNYGAKNRERVREVVTRGKKYALFIELFVILLIELFPEPILKLFNASPEMLSIGTTALRFAAPSLLFGALSVVSGASFQALKHNKFTMVQNICRQIVFILPIAYLFSLTKNLDLVWISIVIGEILGLLLAEILRRKVNRDLGEKWT